MKKSEIKNLLKLAKPCPFCGKRPRLIYDITRIPSAYVLGCANSSCAIQPSTIGIDIDYLPELEAEIKRWNKRAKIQEE